MRAQDTAVSSAISSRRSVRKFARLTVDGDTIERLVALACSAPAPHHSKPWRFVQITSDATRERLSDAMAGAWRADLEQENESVHTIDRLLGRSRRQLAKAPVLLVACLDLVDARPWPDAARQRAERDMFVQSLGAALQNLLLAAGESGLAGYMKGAPLFCPDAVRDALDLPPDWEPGFLVLVGYPERQAQTPQRQPVDLEEFLLER
ncbi:MAG TPA: nitroreductase family protein [Dehalococcoidia bacterium]|jgi:coenzyme F420-0:L-glutamate ligase/coenzyme F420-1:gamma-L-glutamate ligase|nr:nitroreductase family protein [Dehalococcoidia bacterium]